MEDGVAELLRSKNIYFKVSGQDYLIKCLNPDHEDSDPSMRVDRTLGIFNCLSCGFKGNIFKYYGILTNNTSIRVAKLKEKLKSLQIHMDGLELPEGATPLTREFRGISKKTLTKFGAFYTTLVPELEDRVCFPITDISGKTQVFVCRHSLSSGNPRYVNYPRNVRIPSFPAKLDDSSVNYIILVEGIFDLLNTYDKGLRNVVCTFGTNTLKASLKAKMVPYMIQGVTKVYIMFDGDTAGYSAAEELKPLIEQEGFQVEIIRLEDGVDPGELDQEYVDGIREYVNGKNSDNR